MSAGATRPGHGHITSAGSHRTRIGGSACWSLSSWGRDAERRRRRELQRPPSRREARRSHDHLASPREGRAYEAAGDGAAWSMDGGRSWSALDAGRELGYCWALPPTPAIRPAATSLAARGPREAHSAGRAYGRLYRWDGDAWRELPVPGESMPYTLGAVATSSSAAWRTGGCSAARSRRELAGTRGDAADHRDGPRSVTVEQSHTTTVPDRE